MPKKSQQTVRWFRAEVWLSVSALVVSVCALVVSWIQVRVESRQMASSVWPRLTWEQSSDLGPSGKLTWKLANKGVGPAIIQEQVIRLKGKTYPHLLSVLEVDMPDSIRLKENGTRIYFGSYRKDDVMGSGQSDDMLHIEGSPILARWCQQRLDFLMGSPEFQLRFVYEDVFGNRWELNKTRVQALKD